MARYCEKCGTEGTLSASFCQGCGTAFLADTQSSGSLGRAPENRPPSIGKRTCEWCAESVPVQALKCPKCTKWRKDIDEDRIKTYAWGGAGPIVPVILSVIASNEGWWSKQTGYFESSFSLLKFLTSFSGLFVLAGLAISGYYTYYYWMRASKKIGTWWWV